LSFTSFTEAELLTRRIIHRQPHIRPDSCPRPISRIRAKRSSEKGGPNLENGASRPRAVAVAAPSDRFGRSQIYRIGVVVCAITSTLGCVTALFRQSYEAGRNTAPSGTTPSVTYRHKTISSFRANATSRIFFIRPFAPARRSLNHLARALSG